MGENSQRMSFAPRGIRCWNAEAYQARKQQWRRKEGMADDSNTLPTLPGVQPARRKLFSQPCPDTGSRHKNRPPTRSGLSRRTKSLSATERDKPQQPSESRVDHASEPVGSLKRLGANRRHSVSAGCPANDNKLNGVSMGKKQFKVLRELFRQYDVQRTGEITREDFIREVGRITPGISDHAEAMFQAADRDQSGALDFCEFLQMYTPALTRPQVNKLCNKYGGTTYKEDRSELCRTKAQREERQEQIRGDEEKSKMEIGELQKAFGQWCRPGKTTISMKTLRSKCPSVASSELDEWLEQYSTKKNGELNRDEFVTLCSHHYGISVQDNALVLAGNLDLETKAAAKGWFGATAKAG